MKTAVVLTVFVAAFTFLTVSSYVRESATWDEPFHLVAGYSAWKTHDYRIDPEQPPLLRMWAALPLLAMSNIQLDTNGVSWAKLDQWSFGHQFLYQDNDADRLLYRARFMIVLLGLLLGCLIFCWTRELFGVPVATIVLALYTLEPNILAHSRPVTTDLGLTCFMFGTIYFLWRTVHKLRPANLTGLALFFALSEVSKFSALILVPIVALLLLVHSLTQDPWPIRMGQFNFLGRHRLHKLLTTALVLTFLFVVSFVAIWGIYGFRFTPEPHGRGVVHVFTPNTTEEHTAPRLAAAVKWSDHHHILPNAYANGFLQSQVKNQVRGAFLAGNYSTTGWWYYFPFAILVKTPESLLLLWVGAVLLCAFPRTGFFRNELHFILPVITYLLLAMLSTLNIGLRHVLPIYPLLLTMAGKCVAELLRGKRIVLLGLIVMTSFIEFARCTPHYLAYFNSLAGGPANGHQLLLDSNLDWGQDLKGLKRWMNQNGVSHINLSYFGTADPHYYGMNCTYLPGAPFFADKEEQLPQLPGYVAISVTNLRGVYLSDLGRAFYHPLIERKPVAVIGYSIRVYWVEKPWWTNESRDYSSFSGSSPSSTSGAVKPSLPSS